VSDKKSSETSEPKTVPPTKTDPPKSWGDGNETLRVAITNTREKE